jgi:hypothetical protein
VCLLYGAARVDRQRCVFFIFIKYYFKISNDEGAKQHMAPSTIDITSSLDICDGGLIPSRHKEGHVHHVRRQLSNWEDPWEDPADQYLGNW